jgi:salicylate hydroxylase
MPLKVIVGGAGIGGLTAALALIARGFEVRVLEQAQSLGPVGAGIQLSANATRVLFELGLSARLQAVTIVPESKCIRLWSTGQEWRLFDLGRESIVRYGYPYMMLYRPDLHAVLVDALRERSPGALVLGAKIADVGQGADSVYVTLSDGRRFSGDVLIGADGVHSVVRARTIGEDRPRFSGCIAWRGVIPTESLPASMQGAAGVNWVGPGAHVIHYPIHAGKLVGFTGIVEKQQWFRESWTETGSVEECLDDFKGWHADVHALVKCLEKPLKWALMVRDPLANWTVERVTLLGDAAHPTLPFLAQGAAMAVEDACVLARALDETRLDVPAALRTYQANRIERTTKIVLESAATAKRFHNAQLADAADASAYIEREWQESSVRSRYEWLFSYRPESVPLVS